MGTLSISSACNTSIATCTLDATNKKLTWNPSSILPQIQSIVSKTPTSNKKPVLNKDLWEDLIQLMSIHKVEYIKVKGHADNKYNNRCDELAREAIKNITR